MTLVRGALDANTAASWLHQIDAHPAWHQSGDAQPKVFNRYSSSLRLSAVPGLDAVAIAEKLLEGEAGTFCRVRLGNRLTCNIDQCWIRRQYAPSRYPPCHAPHAWHQDGALGFDFIGEPMPPRGDALLTMVTCWLALTPCGSGAPGLELATFDSSALLAPSCLRDAAVRATRSPADFQQPVLAPGDCLAFTGGVLHHTYVTAAMRHDRTSVELRLFDANRIPPRLCGQRFAAVH